jgi:hypothetical protein
VGSQFLDIIFIFYIFDNYVNHDWCHVLQCAQCNSEWNMLCSLLKWIWFAPTNRPGHHGPYQVQVAYHGIECANRKPRAIHTNIPLEKQLPSFKI